MPKVSVIIPCYNAEKYLDQCLRSVLNQTLQDIEILCVDDGSTDNTLAMLNQYAAADSRLRVLRQQNKFAGVARNTGMDAASGEYFAFLDADDFYEPDGLEKAYAIAKENDVQMLKLSSSLLDDRTGEITTNAHYSHQRFIQKNRIVSFPDAPRNLLNCADVAWNGLYKASFIREKGLRFNDFRCVNDRSFYISCLVNADRIMVADEYLTCYRRNIAGSLVSIRHKFFHCQTGSYRLIRDIALNSDLTGDCKKLILRYELNQIFIWYNKFLSGGVNTFQVEEVIRSFVREFDEADVGRDFLKTFPYRHLLKRFRESLEILWQNEAPAAPVISVIMPVHNSVQYLSEAVESILLQSFRDFELLCVNNNSTDASAEILSCFAGKDRRVRVLEETKPGAGMARNAGVREAKGQYLVFVDSDDKIAPDYLQMLLTAAQTHGAQVVTSARMTWTGSGEPVPMPNWVAENRVPMDQPFSWADVPDYILNFTDGAPGGKLFERELILRNHISYLDLKRSEDFNFIFCAIVMAQRVVNLSTSGYYYRKDNPNSLESTKDETPLLFWDATQLFTENLKKLPYFDQLKRSYLNNTINRFSFNLKAVTTLDGFCAIFRCLKSLASEILELDQHEPVYFFDNTSYQHLTYLLQYETPEEFLYAEYRKTLAAAEAAKAAAEAAKAASAPVPAPADPPSGSLLSRFFGCLRQHGLGYTLRLILKKLRRS